MIGLYGTMAYSVTRKTHEIGIRMALGAKPVDVLAMVIRQGIALTLIGVAIGVVVALGVTRLVTSMIFGVTPYDPVTFVTRRLFSCWLRLLPVTFPRAARCALTRLWRCATNEAL